MRTEVWLPLATLILGWAGSQTTEVLRDRRLQQREREIRKEQRHADRQDRLNSLQRENLLALQDAASDFWVAAWKDFKGRRLEFRNTGQWKVLDIDDLPEDWDESTQRLAKFQSRILDEYMRNLVDQLNQQAGLAITQRLTKKRRLYIAKLLACCEQ